MSVVLKGHRFAHLPVGYFCGLSSELVAVFCRLGVSTVEDLLRLTDAEIEQQVFCAHIVDELKATRRLVRRGFLSLKGTSKNTSEAPGSQVQVLSVCSSKELVRVLSQLVSQQGTRVVIVQQESTPASASRSLVGRLQSRGIAPTDPWAVLASRFPSRAKSALLRNKLSTIKDVIDILEYRRHLPRGLGPGTVGKLRVLFEELAECGLSGRPTEPKEMQKAQLGMIKFRP